MERGTDELHQLRESVERRQNAIKVTNRLPVLEQLPHACDGLNGDGLDHHHVVANKVPATTVVNHNVWLVQIVVDEPAAR